MPRKDQSHHSLPPAQNLPPTAPDPDPKQEQEPTVSAKNSDSSTSQKKSFINALLSEDEDEETMLLFAQMKDLRDRLRDFMGIEDFYESLTCTIDMLAAVQAEKDDFDEAEEDPTSQSKQEGDPSPESNGDEDVSNRGLNEGVKTSDGAPKAREAPRRSPRLNSFDVKAYTFTGVKDASIEFYGRTGIDEVFADISEETLCLVIKHPNYDKELDSFWDRRSVDGLIGPLERSTTYVAPVPESGCRWSTLDRVADHVMWGLSECQILPAAFTELSVTRGNEEGEKGSKTAVIIWRKNKTILTGRYDYLFLTIPQDPRYPKFSEMVGLLEQNSFSGIRTKLTDYWLGYARVFVLEAKRSMTAQALRIHLPQVIAQSRVAMRLRKEIDGDGEDGVPFCLSNGKIWFFGLLHRPRGSSDKVQLKVYLTSPLEWNVGASDTLRTIFKALAVWTSVPPAVIAKTLKRK